MRYIKLPLYSILFFFLLITLISLFIPSRVRISRAIDINSSKESIMSLISDPSRWEEWYPGGDSLQVLYIEGKAKGFVLDSATRSIIILMGTDDTSVIAMIHTRKNQIQSKWQIINGETRPITLQWYLQFDLRWYPWEKFSSLFFEKLYGEQLTIGLEQLKRKAETVRQ